MVCSGEHKTIVMVVPPVWSSSCRQISDQKGMLLKRFGLRTSKVFGVLRCTPCTRLCLFSYKHRVTTFLPLRYTSAQAADNNGHRVFPRPIFNRRTGAGLKLRSSQGSHNSWFLQVYSLGVPIVTFIIVSCFIRSGHDFHQAVIGKRPIINIVSLCCWSI